MTKHFYGRFKLTTPAPELKHGKKERERERVVKSLLSLVNTPDYLRLMRFLHDPTHIAAIQSRPCSLRYQFYQYNTKSWHWTLLGGKLSWLRKTSIFSFPPWLISDIPPGVRDLFFYWPAETDISGNPKIIWDLRPIPCRSWTLSQLTETDVF